VTSGRTAGQKTYVDFSAAPPRGAVCLTYWHVTVYKNLAQLNI
jgi:hypothetical protein